MHSGEHLALAATATAAELEMIRVRMRRTVALLDDVIAERRHLRAVPDLDQASAGGSLLLDDLRDEAERISK